MQKELFDEIKKEVLKNEKIDSLMNKIQEYAGELNITKFIEDMEKKAKFKTKKPLVSFKNQILFIGISKELQEIIMDTINSLKSINKIYNKIEVKSLVSFDTKDSDNIKIDLILEGDHYVLEPLKFIFDGIELGEYLAFYHNEEDPSFEIGDLKIDYAPWVNKKYLGENLQKVTKEFINLVGECPLQTPINPLELINLDNKNTNLLAHFRISLKRIFKFDKANIKQNIITETLKKRESGIMAIAILVEIIYMIILDYRMIINKGYIEKEYIEKYSKENIENRKFYYTYNIFKMQKQFLETYQNNEFLNIIEDFFQELFIFNDIDTKNQDIIKMGRLVTVGEEK